MFPSSPFLFSLRDCAAEFLQRRTFPFRFQDASLDRARPWRIATPNFFTLRFFRGTNLALSAFKSCAQTSAREFAIHRLRPRILHGDADSSWPMSQRDRGGNLVDVLTARSTRARESFFEI